MESENYKKGHFIGIGLAICIPIGIPIGLILDNIAIGAIVSLPLGLVSGYIMEKILNKNAMPLTKEELQRRKKISRSIAILGSVLLMIFTIIYLSMKYIL